MKPAAISVIDQYLNRYPKLLVCRQSIVSAVEFLCASFRCGGKLMICGNGGSASDALHIVGELMKGFTLPRPLPEHEIKALIKVSPAGSYLASHLQQALPAIALVQEAALTTAFSNDVAPDLCFAQQVYGYGVPGDTLLAISTSGNSQNVIYASETARFKNIRTIALTGESGGNLQAICDCTIAVPGAKTYEIQELHLPVYHCLCLALEHEFFS